MRDLINKLYDLMPNQLEQVNAFVEDLLHPKKKRSLSQNALAWKYIGMIADSQRLDKEIVHIDMLEHYGQREMISMLSSINPEGYFEYYKKIGSGEVNGKEFTHYYVFKPSHKFDTREMSIYISGILQECYNLGIPTITEEEIKGLKLI